MPCLWCDLLSLTEVNCGGECVGRWVSSVVGETRMCVAACEPQYTAYNCCVLPPLTFLLQAKDVGLRNTGPDRGGGRLVVACCAFAAPPPPPPAPQKAPTRYRGQPFIFLAPASTSCHPVPRWAFVLLPSQSCFLHFCAHAFRCGQLTTTASAQCSSPPRGNIWPRTATPQPA